MKSSLSAASSGSAERVQKHRARLRAKGLKARTVWLPDTSNAAFVKEYRHQLAKIARSAETRHAVEAFEGIAETRGWV